MKQNTHIKRPEKIGLTDSSMLLAIVLCAGFSSSIGSLFKPWLGFHGGFIVVLALSFSTIHHFYNMVNHLRGRKERAKPMLEPLWKKINTH